MAGLEDDRDRHTGIGTPAAHGRCSFPSPTSLVLCVIQSMTLWGTFHTSREVGRLTRYLHVVHTVHRKANKDSFPSLFGLGKNSKD